MSGAGEGSVDRSEGRTPGEDGRDETDASPAVRPSEAVGRAYWKANLRVLLPLLVLWFVVSYGAGILFVDVLDRFTLPFTDVPFGFWMAQQGAIYIFVGIIFVYVTLMNRLDREFGVHED